MKFDPSTWQLQVGRKWRHLEEQGLFLIETEKTHLSADGEYLDSLKVISDNPIFGADGWSDIETIDEDQGEDQPAPSVVGDWKTPPFEPRDLSEDELRGLWNFHQHPSSFTDVTYRNLISEVKKLRQFVAGIGSKEEFSQMSLLDREWFIYNTLQSLIQKINTMAGTITDLKNAVTAEETVEQGLITLVNGLGAQIKAALPNLSADDQATLDGVIASVNSDAAAMQAAVTANTPAAPAPTA